MPLTCPLLAPTTSPSQVLGLLKDDKLKDSDRQREVGKILSTVPNAAFNKLVNIGKSIHDFKQDGGDAEEEDHADGAIDEEQGVAVVFEGDEEDDENNGGYMDAENDGEDGDDDDDDDEGGEEQSGRRGVVSGAGGDDDGDDDGADDSLPARDVDAYWLQRQLAQHYSDAAESASLAEAVLEALGTRDPRACENALVGLLDFDKFDLVRLLLLHRAKVFYLSRYHQAQTAEEKASVEREMAGDEESGGPALLKQLHAKASAQNWAEDRTAAFASQARREARALRGDGNGDGDADGGDGDSAPTSASAPASKARAGKTLDLEGLQFSQGGRVMSNTKCELPDKSVRLQKVGYEEVHVPAVRPVIPPGEKLVEVSELPEWAQAAFPGIPTLNRIQSKMLPAAMNGTENMLLCAPTGAGKTNVALMTILNQLGQHRREDGSFDLDAFKVVYIAPMKALVQECVLSFGKKLAPFGIKVAEMSGDQNLGRAQIEETQMIVTTPEKWDVVTRKAGDRAYTQLVRLMIIDEIHLLHDERGPVLETLVARTLRQVETTREMVRLVGLSATLPNFEDVATFLRVNPAKGLFFFDNSFRPVPLQQQYIGVSEKKAIKRYQLMNEICYEKVLAGAGKHQVLIFVHSRAETAKTARALRDLAIEHDTLSQFVPDASASSEILREEAEGCKSEDLKEVLPAGFAIHHAGMTRSDRSLVEDLFSDKHVQVLVSTATLAWGVNLPAHTVILKGTQMYSPEEGRWTELSPLDVMQMMGRAGRYGLDSEGEGIILTQHSELQYYLSLMNQQLPIESQFVKRLPDMLNAEVALGAVSSVSDAADWLGYTYLFVRMLRRPALYGVAQEEIDADPSLYQRRYDLAHSAAMILDKAELLKYDRRRGTLSCSVLGRVASGYYVTHESMAVYNQFLRPQMSDVEVFRLFSLSGEFSNIHVREEEKIELSKLLTRVPVPVKEGVEEPSAKVNVLLQAYISRLKLDGFALVADMTYVQQSACRLMRALFEVALKRGWAALAVRLLQMCKMVERRLWSSQSPLRQFKAVPDAILRRLEKNSDIGWDRYADLTPQDLGEMVKLPKMGRALHKYVHMFPRLEVQASVQPITRALMRVDVTLTPDYTVEDEKGVEADSSTLFWVIVEDVNGEKILHAEPFNLSRWQLHHDHELVFTVPLLDPVPPQYFLRVVADRWLHCQVLLPISFRALVLPSKFPPPTELLDLQPLPITALVEPDLIKLYARQFSYFNAVQTQAFQALFESDESVLVGAPPGSGKTVCAELALLRHLLREDEGKGKCVYIAPRKETADCMAVLWGGRFSALGVNVVRLSGESAADVKLLAQGDVVVASAVEWDQLSRRWRQRKHVQQVGLYLVDDLHLIGGSEGPALEVVVSRARYVASQLERPVRIVAMSASLANARDLSDWMGVTPTRLFNFRPDARPTPLHVRLRGFDVQSAPNRLLAMGKPVFAAAAATAAAGARRTTLVFVPTRKQTKLTAVDMVTFATAASTPDVFLGGTELDVGGVHDKALRHTASKGVGFIHAGLSGADRTTVQQLFAEGKVTVLVVPLDLLWTALPRSHAMVVMDTAYYEGREHRVVDYASTDLMRMTGLACRITPALAEEGEDHNDCSVFCYTPRLAYLQKMLAEPLPVESHLDHAIHDHLCAEVVTKTVESKQDAVDYLTWTWLYRRLLQNPNYYNMAGATHQHLSDHLSALVEDTVTDLEESKCIAVEEDMELSALNLGMISAFYYIQYTSVELFASSVSPKTRIKGLVEVLAASSEFGALSIRAGEARVLERMARHLPQKMVEGADYEDVATKVLVLLQAHFSRSPLSTDFKGDLNTIILEPCVKLLQALVDVVASMGWLKPALAAMELSQMVVQGMWEKDSVLLQIPHFDKDRAALCAAHPSAPVESVLDILDLEDDVRDELLAGLSDDQVSDVALFCNSYPSVDVSFQTDLEEGGEVEAGDSVTVMVALHREIDEDEEEDPAAHGRVKSVRFPGKNKVENWWCMVGRPGGSPEQSLLGIKRVPVGATGKAKLEFSAPEELGRHDLVLYCMCDSYMGCDQEHKISITVVVATSDDDDEGEAENGTAMEE